MKKLNKTFILIVLLLIVTFFIKRDKVVSTEEYYITTTGLNIRTGVGNKRPIAFTLKKGDEVEIISKKRGWYKISYEGKFGYAHPKFLVKQERTLNQPNFFTSQQFKTILVVVFMGVLLVVVTPVCMKLYRRTRDKKLLKTVTELDRGTVSERDLVLKLLKFGILNQDIFHDLYVKKDENNFSQIDLVATTDVGIIVFEVKDYSGWIYGNGSNEIWTQVLAYGKQKYRFQNPIIQNDGHILTLKNRLNNRDLPIYSVIVFYGNCVLKNINFVPRQTFITRYERIFEVLRTIIDNNPKCHYQNKPEILRILEEAKFSGGIIETRNQHTANVRDMLGTDRIFD